LSINFVRTTGVSACVANEEVCSWVCRANVSTLKHLTGATIW